MRAANENYSRKSGEKAKKGNFTRVRVLVPKDKVIEIKSMAFGLLRESLEGKKSQPKKLSNRFLHFLKKWSTWYKGLRYFSRRRTKVEKDAVASLAPLRLGKRRIHSRAPVKSDRRSSPEGTRRGAERTRW